jgi:hypothetical protein
MPPVPSHLLSTVPAGTYRATVVSRDFRGRFYVNLDGAGRKAAVMLESFAWPQVATGPAVVTTTIAAGSNGLALPQATINVTATSGAATSGAATVSSSAGLETVTYTGTTSSTLTGCTGGTGTMATGGAVTLPGSPAHTHGPGHTLVEGDRVLVVAIGGNIDDLAIIGRLT